MKDRITQLFLQYLKSCNVSEKTLRYYKSDLALFTAWLVFKIKSLGADCENLQEALPFLTNKTAEEYKEFLIKNGNSVQTINRRLSTLRTLSKFLLDNNFLSFNFAKNIKNISKAVIVPPLERVATEFSNYLEVQKASFLTRKNYLADINQFLRFIEKQGKKDLQEITSKDIKRYLIIELASSPEATKDRKISSLKKFFSWAKEEKKTNINPVEDYLKDTAYIKPIERSLSELTETSINRKVFGNYPSYEGLKARINAYLAGKPRLQKLVYHLLYTRPKWYKAYHSLAISRYLNFAILVIFATGLGFGIYQQLFAKPQTPIAYPSQPVTPKRYLSFQGRLTNQYQTPITTPTNIVFKLYDEASGGNTLWNQAGVTCSVDPDEDGIFSILLGTTSGEGYTCTGISAIDSSVFTENSEVWLGIKVGSDPEATPRIQIATVAYALNAETVQGYPIDATGSATKNTILTMNSGGEVVLAEVGPKIKSVSGNFSVQGEAVTIQANGGGVAGDITLSPASDGTVSILASGTTNDSLYIQNAQITSGALIHGYYGGASTTVDLLKLGAGATESTKFLVESSGDTFIASGADLFIGGIGLNDNSSTSSGASLIGLYDDSMTYISGNTNVQNAIKQLDTAIGTVSGSAGGWTDDGTIVRLTTSSDRVGIGTTSVNANTKVGILGNLAIGSQSYSDAQAPTNGLIVEGNVGIGTTAPSKKLEVDGTAWINVGSVGLSVDQYGQVGIGTTLPNFPLEVKTTEGTLGFVANFVDATSGQGVMIGGRNNTGIIGSYASPYNLSLNPDGGNVGVGTTAPNYKLDVAGSFHATQTITSYDNIITVDRNGGGDYTTINAAITAINNAGDASSSNPYVIWIMAGTYDEDITVPSYVSLKGQGFYSTIIDGRVTLAGHGSHIQNLWIYPTGSETIALAANESTSSNSVNFITNCYIAINPNTDAPAYAVYNTSNNDLRIYNSFVYARNQNSGANAKAINFYSAVTTNTAAGDIEVQNSHNKTSCPNNSRCILATNDSSVSGSDIIVQGTWSVFNDTSPEGAVNNSSNGQIKLALLYENDSSDYAMYTTSGNNVVVEPTKTGNIASTLGTGFTTGTGFSMNFPAATTLTGALTGINLDLSTNLTYGNNAITGITLNIPSSGTATSKGLEITGAADYGLYISGETQNYLSGNVGIGITNPNDAKIHVYQSSGIFPGGNAIKMEAGTDQNVGFSLSSNNKQWQFSKRNSAQNDSFQFYHYNGTSWETAAMTMVSGGYIGIGTTVPTKGKLNVLGAVAIGSTAYTETSGAAPTNGLIVEGNVGIGTTGPNRKLEVAGSGTTNPGDVWSALRISDSIEPTTYYLEIAQTILGSSAGFRYDFNLKDYFGLGSGVIATPLTIYKNGNVGIGTTAPGYKLEVNGDIYSSANIRANTDLYIAGTALSANTTTTSGASKIGLYDDAMTYISGNTNVQSAIKQLDTAIGTVSGSAGGWTDDGTIVRLTTSTDRVGIGTTSVNNNTKVGILGNLAIGSQTYSDAQAPTNGLIVEGNVGIGTTSPNYPLEISKNTNGEQIMLSLYNPNSGEGIGESIYFYSHANAYPAAKIKAYTNSGSAGRLQFFTGNGGALNTMPAIQILENNNVGIGITNPSNKLDVNGIAAIIDSVTGTRRLTLDYGVSAGAARILTGASDDLILGVNSTDVISIDGDNATYNVGIGTTSPSYKLDVNGDARISTLASGSTDTVVTHSSGVLQSRTIDSRVWGSSLLDGSSLTTGYLTRVSDSNTLTNSIVFDNGTNVGIGTTVPTKGKLNVLGSVAIGSTAYTETSGAAPSNGLIVEGNVGIGITNPGAKVEINYGTGAGPGNIIQGGGAVFENIALRLWDTGTGANNINILEFGHNSTYVAGARIRSVNPANNATTGANLILETTSNNSGTWNSNQLVLNRDGNVGIGTTSPSTFKLEVAGSVGPSADNTYDLGSSGRRWANIYGTNIYGNITPTGFTQGSVIFAGAGGTLSQNNANFFWDNTNLRLGIGTTAPSVSIDSTGSLRLTAGTFQIGNAANVAYNRIGTNATNRGLSAATDLLINGKLEVDQAFFPDSGIYGSGGTLVVNFPNNDAWFSDEVWVDGKIGIGTTTPANKLSVIGGVNIGSTSYNVAAPTNGLIVEGNVGIGTTGPGAKLDVYGGLRVTNPSATGYYSYLNSNWAQEDSFELGISGHKLITSGNYYYGSVLKLWSADAERMRIDSSGNVGIGTSLPTKGKLNVLGAVAIGSTAYTETSGAAPTNGLIVEGNVGIGTTSPSDKLHVRGNIFVTANNAIAFGYDSSFTDRPKIWSPGSQGALNFETQGSMNFFINTDNVSGTADAFAIYNDTTSNPLVYVQAAGNVGIGTTSPVHNFQVYRTSLVNPSLTYSTGATAGIRTEDIDIAFGAYTASPWAAWIQARHTTNIAWPLVINPLGGNVGIGITNPSTTLHVYGTGGDNTAITVRDSDGSCTGNPESGSFSWTCSSDARLKTNITDTNPLLSRLMQIKIRDYTLISSGERATGVIAQELQTVFPELVNVGQDGYLVVSEPSNWILIKGMQEQQAQITNLGQQIAQLESSLSTQLAGLSLTSTGDLNIAQTQDGDYQVQNSQTGDIITRLSAFAEVVIGKIRAGSISAYEITTNGFIAFQAQVDNLLVKTGLVSPSVQTAMISPLADERDIVIKLGGGTGSDPVQGKLSIQNQNGEEVASINSEGDATFSGTLKSENLAVENNATISGDLTANNINTGEIRAEKLVVDQIISPSGYNSGVTLEQIEELLRQAQADQNLLGQAEDWYNATSSAQIKNLAAETATLKNLFVTQSIAANSLSLSQSISLGTDMVIQSQLIDERLVNSIDTLTAPLSIQSLALAPVEIMAGKIRIETNGDVYIAGNLYVAGRVESTGLTVKTAGTGSDPVRVEDEDGNLTAGISASGSAQFKELASDKIVIAGASVATGSATLQNGEINTNASAGSGILPAGQKEIAIVSPNIKSESLVYVTPTSDTKNYVLYVKAKEDGRMVVSFNRALDIDVYFNWWVVETR